MEQLRAPDGCPWDREQNLRSLRPYIIEEAYELIQAINKEDAEDIREECGDLLLQVIFISQIAKEHQWFDISGVLDAISEKLVRRHPHVFGNVNVDTSSDVSRNWDEIKAEEKKKTTRKSRLSGIPQSLPALIRAHQLQERAAKVGFDWPKGDQEAVFGKIEEELQEVQEAMQHENQQHIEEELGDLFFALVNLSRRLDMDAELLLQEANEKFTKRFEYVEQRVEETAGGWVQHELEELEAYWKESKQK
ncbi:MAG: nucleoside triphosphate pyrophosphohydrolase [Synergistales bacterium]|nr:nucleoside triphosphate pyrophosphohydrolase [Synergistales bacterium]